MSRRQYCGFKVKQRSDAEAVSFFVFAARPSDIVQWSTVDRLEEREGGFQRRLTGARVRAMQRFFTLDPRNVIPTSIVLAFSPGITTFTRLEFNLQLDCDNQPNESYEWGILSFEFDPNLSVFERPAFVVDGQHRLNSMAGLSPDQPLILVSALLDAEPNEQAFQFIVINNKVAKVPPDLVRSLIVDLREDALQERLETARVSLQPQALLVGIVDDESESPLYQMIKWERRRGQGNPAINPAAVEDSLKYMRRRFATLDEEEDSLIDFFFAVWHGVKKAYSELWQQVDNNLFSNAGFKAFSEHLTDELRTLITYRQLGISMSNPDSITKAATDIASQIDRRFWLVEWKLKSLDTSGGRETIKEDLRRISNNFQEERAWWEGLTLVGIQPES